MKALVIGHGSIGKRHSSLLAESGIETSILSRRTIESDLVVYNDLNQAISSFGVEDVVMVCNESSLHADTLDQLEQLGFRGHVLVEKPLAAQPIDMKYHFNTLGVTYNLRFYNALVELKNRLQDQSIYSAHLYVGQFLPDWRCDVDYKKGYSANDTHGGGVGLDLSHEVDYCQWLLGDIVEARALISNQASFEVKTETAFSILAQSNRCPNISIHLNYLDQPGKRFCTINCEQGSYRLDFLHNILSLNDERIDTIGNVMDTYQYQVSSIKEMRFDQFCSFNEANSVVVIIEQLKRNGVFSCLK